MSELRELADELHLVSKGNKMALIERILHFLRTGEKTTLPKFPEISCARRGVSYPLHPDTRMLKGAYKNDLKTRLFFKQLIGDHFHFTAFGVDWLNDRWMEGNPPTYREFASMWQERHKIRKKPKEEWAYINFVQQQLSKGLSRDQILRAWECERQKHKAKVEAWFKEYKQKAH